MPSNLLLAHADKKVKKKAKLASTVADLEVAVRVHLHEHVHLGKVLRVEHDLAPVRVLRDLRAGESKFESFVWT